MIDATVYLHSKNIIHWDIKPENILLSFNGVKLTDFGWSIHSPKGSRKTFCGTLEYLAPEILRKNEYDKSVDIWCLGILTYEMSTG